MDNLHIKSKKKNNGLINTTIDTKNKKNSAKQMFLDIYNSYVKQGSSHNTPYIITEYCWRLIEEDLAQIRKFLMEKKSNNAVFKGFSLDRSNCNSRLQRDFNTEINSIITEKFRIITSWFNKPSIASPSTDLILLFRAVISEIQGLFDQFSPKIICDSDNFTVNGGLYFIIYDALFVLIHNAAEYGINNGLLELKIEILQEQKYIKLVLISEVEGIEALNHAEKNINEILKSDFTNAHITEGRSGIKKLKQLEKDNHIEKVEYYFERPNRIISSFNHKVEV